jgi:nicotinamide mononucleotide (NMN) deamidase PncC
MADGASARADASAAAAIIGNEGFDGSRDFFMGWCWVISVVDLMGPNESEFFRRGKFNFQSQWRKNCGHEQGQNVLLIFAANSSDSKPQGLG